MEQLRTIAIESLVESPYQGRLVRKLTKRGKSDDPAMQALMNSITSKGLMTPIIVRPHGEMFEIVDGHRRVEAYRRLNKVGIEAIVKEYDDKDAQVFSVIGNMMRQNLNLIEKALAFKKILDAEGFKQKELSKAIGKHETYVSDILNTLEMDQRIIDDLVANKTTEDVRLLRAIRRVDTAKKNKSDKQWALYQRYQAENLTRKDIINTVKESKVSTQAFKIEGSSKSFSIHLSKKLTPDRKNKFEQYLKDKIAEWLAEEAVELL